MATQVYTNGLYRERYRRIHRMMRRACIGTELPWPEQLHRYLWRLMARPEYRATARAAYAAIILYRDPIRDPLSVPPDPDWGLVRVMRGPRGRLPG